MMMISSGPVIRSFYATRHMTTNMCIVTRQQEADIQCRLRPAGTTYTMGFPKHCSPSTRGSVSTNGCLMMSETDWLAKVLDSSVHEALSCTHTTCLILVTL